VNGGAFINFLNDCGAEPNAINPVPNSLCNNDVAFAMGFNYIVTPGFEEIISFTVTPTAPAGGFYLEQLHPVDPANPLGVTPVFLYGSAEQVSVIPEPSTLSMLIPVIAILGSIYLRHNSRHRAASAINMALVLRLACRVDRQIGDPPAVSPPYLRGR
jgi:hypothetical protein